MKSSSDPDRLVEAGSADFRRWQAPLLDSAAAPPRTAALAGKRADPQPDEPLPVEDVAEPLRLPTAEEIEQIREQAREEGYREGHQQGHAEGLESGRAEQDALLERMRAILRALDHPLRDLDVEVEAQLTQLALQVARAVVQRELSYSREQLLGIVRKALRQLPAQDRGITIFCHPEDEAILHLAAEEEGWMLEEDPSLTPGGCRIESGASRIDATIGRRWATVALQMLGEVPEGLAEPVPETLEPEQAGQTPEVLSTAAEEDGPVPGETSAPAGEGDRLAGGPDEAEATQADSASAQGEPEGAQRDSEFRPANGHPRQQAVSRTQEEAGS
ncbi:MAG: flagellar assembly protein FliH [Halothiobacillaceae bacterium]